MRDRIALWKHAFDVDETGVSPTLSQLAWNVAAFSCMVEMVRQAPNAPDGGKRLNGLVIELLASGFWSSTMLAVRRLVDRAHPLQGRHGVCSIGAIVNDVRSVRRRLTRRRYVEDIGGAPYNYELVRKRHWDYLERQSGGGVIWIPRDLDEAPSELRHVEFDRLSGTTPGTSSDVDLIRVEVFDRLDARLARLDGVVEHATLHFAHAASEASRAGRVLDGWGLEQARVSLQDVAQVAELVGRWFCGSGIGSVLPTPQFDVFEHLDVPLFTGDPATLQATWDAFAAEAGGWHSIDHDIL